MNKLTSLELELKVTFEHPAKISRLDEGPDEFSLTFTNSSWLKSIQNDGRNLVKPGYKVNKITIPWQQGSDEAEKQAAQLETMQSVFEKGLKALTSNILVSFLLGISLQSLWSAINSMQLVLLMSYIDMKHQPNLSSFMKLISSLL